jgi:hypothetical protein
MAFVCIYCKCSPPAAEPSIAHVFPAVLGGSEVSKDTVCRACNHDVNRRVEMPALQTVLAFQSLFGIRGSRNKIRRVRGTAKLADVTATVYLNDHGHLTDAVVIPQVSPDGKKHYSIFGPGDLVEVEMKKIEASIPDVRWEERPVPEPAVVEVEFASSDSIELLRRLAAKVAFERFAQIRTAERAADSDFNAVRSFILDGTYVNHHCAGAVVDRGLLDGLFRKFEPPSHAVYVTAHPRDNILGAFVVFYGLFYFWVILSRHFLALGPIDDLLLEDPQARQAENPLLRGSLGSVRFQWGRIMAPYLSNPIEANKQAGKRAIAKLRTAADAFYGPQ